MLWSSHSGYVCDRCLNKRQCHSVMLWRVLHMYTGDAETDTQGTHAADTGAESVRWATTTAVTWWPGDLVSTMSWCRQVNDRFTPPPLKTNQKKKPKIKEKGTNRAKLSHRLFMNCKVGSLGAAPTRWTLTCISVPAARCVRRSLLIRHLKYATDTYLYKSLYFLY